MNFKTLYIILFSCLFCSSFSQYDGDKKIAAQKLSECSHDSCKIYYLNLLSLLNQGNDFKASYDYANKALELAERIKSIRGKVSSLNHLGNAYWYNNNFVEALTYYYKAYKINDSINDKKGIAESLYNIGWIKVMQQRNNKEISYLYRSLAIYEGFNDFNGKTSLYNTLGQYYSGLYSETNEKKYFDSSYSYFDKAIKFVKSGPSKNRRHYPKYYSGLADLFASSGDYNSAIFYKEKSIEYHLRSNDSLRYYSDIDDISNYEFKRGNLAKAIELGLKCYNYGKRINKQDLLLSITGNLHNYFVAKKDILKAYDYLKENVELKDSLDQQLFSSNLNDIQNSFEINKREADIKQLKQDNEIQELKGKQNKFALLGVGIVLLIIIVIAYLLYKQNKQKQSANLLLQEQNNIITQKKQEIEHSIQYAKGIQTALLPEIKDIKNVFPEGFIYYLPKDVVSGDFYWFHKLADYFYLVAADCTGHGVPGALMSIVSMDKITQAIFEKKLTEPNEILKFLNIEIKNALKQHDDETKQRDGLDIALVRINIKTQELMFAAANRPLYIVSNGKLADYKSDKVAIAGFTPDDHPFKQLSLQLKKGDCIYISTDGYADQFGGSESKKFMTRNFKSLLESLSKLTMNEQENELINSHLTWKGKYEQVDDILVIGIKI